MSCVLTRCEDLQTEVFRKAPFLEFLEQPERVSGNELWMEGVERVQAREAALRAEQGPKARYVLDALLRYD